MVLDRGGDYLFALKANRPAMLREVETFCADHGRIEQPPGREGLVLALRHALLGDGDPRPGAEGDQRDRQEVQQFVPLRISPPRIGDLAKGVSISAMRPPPETMQNPDQPEREALFLKCDSPGQYNALVSAG